MVSSHSFKHVLTYLTTVVQSVIQFSIKQLRSPLTYCMIQSSPGFQHPIIASSSNNGDNVTTRLMMQRKRIQIKFVEVTLVIRVEKCALQRIVPLPVMRLKRPLGITMTLCSNPILVNSFLSLYKEELSTYG